MSISSAQKDLLNNGSVWGQDAQLGTLMAEAGRDWPTTDFLVNPNTDEPGSDDYDGNTWDKALRSLMGTDGAVARVAALGGRGNARILCKNGGYAEAVVLPDNADAPFCQLIGQNPTPGGSFGSSWIQSPDADEPAITVAGRGWLIMGFEIAAVANTPAILLASTAGGNSANGTQIMRNLITGWGLAGSQGIDVIYNGAPYTKILGNTFDGLLDDAITCSESGFDNPRWWEIAFNQFRDNANHIDFVAKGLDEGWIHDNNFMKVGANRTATLQIALTAGNNNSVGPNNFLSSTYDNAGGYYPGTNDYWYGNASEDGFTTAVPAA